MIRCEQTPPLLLQRVVRRRLMVHRLLCLHMYLTKMQKKTTVKTGTSTCKRYSTGGKSNSQLGSSEFRSNYVITASHGNNVHVVIIAHVISADAQIYIYIPTDAGNTK